ncbi:K+/H+ antiporter subunit F [Aliarcobacter skirrowii]|uniref:K+/H+ antiporter subunit F n=1 Tax=Aliarcobacter skirrowii TaxID=28200 RepID=UPI0029A3B9E4|nr:K+/H+ antiporter subunit F [Aliarcobacter skirrowii]MDX4011781.1 K+/H+ antiporter subunit F [Aliarcobacter skirrowii]
MLELVIQIAFVMIAISIILNIYRLVTGPSVADRILSLDTIYVNAIALLIILSIYLNNNLYFEAALLIAVMGFVGTVALSKYLLRGDIMD